MMIRGFSIKGNSIGKRAVVIIVLLTILIASNSSFGQAFSTTNYKPPVLLGTYIRGTVDQTTLDQEVVAMDQWSGKKSSIVALMRDFETSPAKLSGQLDLLWNAGYTPFLNLDFGQDYSDTDNPTAYQIAVGQMDAIITPWAQAIAAWASGGKWLYIALLPEMNTTWTSYGGNPINYKFAYAHVVQLFTQNGVSDADVRWVFAPNGWAQLVFEPYYPGDDLVDVVGFSAFNQGNCRESSDLWYWNPPTTTFGFEIKKLNQLAPEKPIFITRAATTSETQHNISNPTAKNQWIQDAYAYLAVQRGVRAVIYYNTNFDWECDWEVYRSGSVAYDGYRQAVSNPAYGYISPLELAEADLISSINRDNFVPIITKGVSGSQSRILLGIYTQEWTGLQRVMVNEINSVNNWSGKHLSIIGTFVDFIKDDPTINIELQLETIWENGYMPFLNLNTFDPIFTARRIAEGGADNYLREIARSYAMYAKGGLQKAFIAPLNEMNASVVPYSGDPKNFILAYKRIQNIFSEEGVPDGSVAWVFAPNGSGEAGMPEMEEYYPGNLYVDYNGITAYHFGYCDGVAPQYQSWASVADTFGYLPRIISLSPEKEVFITQTGTSSETYYGSSDAAKNTFLHDMYRYLSGFPELRGVIYYNRWNADCDWAFYNPSGKQYTGYITGTSNGLYGFFTPFTQTKLFFP